MPNILDSFYILDEDNENGIMFEGDLEPYIYRYHSPNKPSVFFNCVKDKNTDAMNAQYKQLYMGVELEFDSRNVRTGSRYNKLNIIEKSNNIWGNNVYLYYMLDGSLSHGLEMISQPSTFEFYQANYSKFDSTFKTILEAGFKSDTYRSCGLHIHFNKDFYGSNPSENIEKLLTIMDKFWKEFVIFTQRNYESLLRYAHKHTKVPKEVVNDMNHGMFPDRYTAININNRNTIEFRIFRGTLNTDKFFMILEFVKNIIMYAKNHTLEEIGNMQFEDLLTTEEMKRYFKKCHTAAMLRQIEEYDII